LLTTGDESSHSNERDQKYALQHGPTVSPER
jgi:hypothetical protein